MSRKVRSLPLVLIVVATLFVTYAAANNPALSDSEQPMAAGSSFGSGGGIVLSNPGLMVVTTAVPMQIPNHVLQPGTYDFELINSANAVKVYSVTDHRFCGAYLVIPASRARATDDAQVTVAAAPNGGPDRIAAWFFPGELNGYAFLYPKKEHKAPVVAMK